MRVPTLQDLTTTPVDIETFIKDPEYLGAYFTGVYPYWVDKLKSIYADPLHPNCVEVWLAGSYRTGRTTAAVIGFLYDLYILTLVNNPHEIWSLMPSTSINLAIIGHNVNGCYSDMILDALSLSPYFRSKILPGKERFDYVGTHQHLGKCKYGSDEYKKSLEYLGPALKHHYEVNDHHPEHFENGVDGMNLMQLVELFCDWDAVCHRNKDGNIYQSLEKNKERFTLSDDLYTILKITADIFEGKTENVSETDMDLCGLVLVWLDCLAGHGGKTDAGLYEELDAISGTHKFSNQIYHIVLNTATALGNYTKE